MTKALRALIRQKKKAVDRLENEILAEMARLAKRKKLTCVVMGFSSCYERGEHVHVEVPELDRLDELYCDEVHRVGFQGIWTPEKGWH